MSAVPLLAGFDAPVREAQQAFRCILDALARPGRLQQLPCPVEQPPGMGAAMAAVVLSLADHETPVWLAPGLTNAAAYAGFHTGCPVVDHLAAATFVLTAAADAPPLDDLPPGSDAYPDRSATLVIEVASLTAGPPLTLTGPGIRDRTALRVDGLPRGFTAAWARNTARYPRGVDVLLTAGDRICGLPRTVTIREA